jgi:hypothetical protein
MAIYGYPQRARVLNDVVAFPALKGSPAGASTVALTLTSGVLQGFENPGIARVTLSALNAQKIGSAGDSITVEVYASTGDTQSLVNTASGYRADTYYKVGTYKDLRFVNTSGLAINQQFVIPLAEKLKIVATLKSSDSLLAGHGCKVDVEFQDLFAGAHRTVYIERPYTQAYGFVGATVAFGDSAVTTAVATSPVLACGASPSAVYAAIQVDDRSKYTTAVAGHGRFGGKYSYAIQTSPDGVRWSHGDSFPEFMRPNGGTGIFLASRVFDNISSASSTVQTAGQPGKFQSFLRLVAYGDTFCSLAAGHGTRLALIAFE